MIATFRDKLTAAIFQGHVPRRVSADSARAAYSTMLVVDRAKSLQDLKGVGLSLEALKRDRAGQHSIRVSRGWRICFRWQDGHAYDVEFTNHYR
jgi:toxin HigB-1